MLSRLASRGSYGLLFAGGLVAGIAAATVLQLAKPTPPPPPTFVCIEPMAAQHSSVCSADDEIVRATAVIHYFDDEVQYATAEDPMSAKAAALLALPMSCTTSEYSYPALSRHIESAATIALQRGDRQTAMRLVEVGHAYGVDPHMLRTIVDSTATR